MFKFLKRTSKEDLLRNMEKKFTKYYGFNPCFLVEQDGVVYKFLYFSDILGNDCFSPPYYNVPASEEEVEVYNTWETIKKVLNESN